MKKLKVPSLVTIAILTVITISFWIVFSVLRVFTTKTETAVPKEIMEPVNPTYDKSAVDNIQGRLYFDTTEVFQSPEPTITASPTASPTESPTATPVATGSGNLGE